MNFKKIQWLGLIIFIITITQFVDGLSVEAIQSGDEWEYTSSEGEVFKDIASQNIENVKSFNLIDIQTKRPIPQLFEEHYEIYVDSDVVDNYNFTFRFIYLDELHRVKTIGMLFESLSDNIEVDMECIITYQNGTTESKSELLNKVSGWSHLVSSDTSQTLLNGAKSKLVWDFYVIGEGFTLSISRMLEFLSNGNNEFSLDVIDDIISLRVNDGILGSNEVSYLVNFNLFNGQYDIGYCDYLIEGNACDSFTGSVPYTSDKNIMNFHYKDNIVIPDKIDYITQKGESVEFVLTSETTTIDTPSVDLNLIVNPNYVILGLVIFVFIKNYKILSIPNFSSKY